MSTSTQKITVETWINAPVSKVWSIFNEPEHITQWATASEEWHTPSAQNDLREGGEFKNVMAAKDGSFSFEFAGVYAKVDDQRYIEYNMADGRNVQITFAEDGDNTRVTEIFDAENTNPIEMQKQGWQAILDNLKKHVESN